MRQKTPIIEYRVREVQTEGDNTHTLILDPSGQAGTLTYEAGQFLTLHLPVADERTISRSYSFSSCPASDPYPTITIKREPDGEGSNWLLSNAREGTILRGAPASGSFRLDASDRPLRLFAAGVGVTPIFSLCKQALHCTDRSVHLHYSSTDPESDIFSRELTLLERDFPDRFTLSRHYSGRIGRLTGDDIRRIISSEMSAVNFVCGPSRYIQLIRESALEEGVNPHDIVSEAFTPITTTTIESSSEADQDYEGTITIDSEVHTVRWPRSKTLIDTLSDCGIDAPSSCRQGECLTCECRIIKGSAEMRHNGVLDEEDVADGYALACQLVPKSPSVHVAFE